MNSVYTKKLERVIRQGCDFSPDLFNIYNKAIVTELEVMSKLIIGGKILNICDADDTVLTVDIEKKIQELLQMVIKKSKKKKNQL